MDKLKMNLILNQSLTLLQYKLNLSIYPACLLLKHIKTMMHDFINVFIMNFYSSIITQLNFSLLSEFAFCKNILMISQFHPFFFGGKPTQMTFRHQTRGENNGPMRCPNDHRCTLRSTRSAGRDSNLLIPCSLDLRLSYQKQSKTAHSLNLDFPVSLQKQGHFHGSLIGASQLLQCRSTMANFLAQFQTIKNTFDRIVLAGKIQFQSTIYRFGRWFLVLRCWKLLCN